MVHPHNCGSAVRHFLNFAQLKGPVGRSLNSQDMIPFMITTGSLNSQDK